MNIHTRVHVCIVYIYTYTHTSRVSVVLQACRPPTSSPYRVLRNDVRQLREVLLLRWAFVLDRDARCGTLVSGVRLICQCIVSYIYNI